ncbi:piggyBac transposable element-derived protein 4-like [Stegodyphus dumicola]|uniref:piggyBac transposable element-derived protein 4-like n=1 Tax=Stegodyphus dumicola TaxID=202533 RepID=UPI0015B05B46|nr:piggyBac transposable element-derived protein 4-like [Stegodyphus dumicola]
MSRGRTQYAAPPSMYRKNIVPPKDYLRILEEVSVDEDSDNLDNASDIDESVQKISKLNLEEAWAKDGTGIEILQGVMGLKRFRNLCAAIRFDDKGTTYVRRKTDKLAALREFFESFNQNCQNVYTPGDELTIDEKLESFRGKCSFIQFIPNKPAKYGLKILAVVDSQKFYTLKLEIYCGNQPPGPYEASYSSIHIVKRLIRAYEGSNRNLKTYNWYTSCR